MRSQLFTYCMTATAAVLLVNTVAAGPHSIDTVVLSGDAPPGFAEQTGFRFFSAPIINDTGQLIFEASVLLNDGIDFGNDEGLWLWDGNNANLLLRQNQTLPGLDPTVTLAEVGYLSDTPRFDSYGRIISRADLWGPTVTSSNDLAIIYYEAGVWQVLSREGDMLPGTSSTENWSSLFSPALIGSSDVLITGRHGGSGRPRVMVAGPADGLSPFLVEGETLLPGMLAGEQIDQAIIRSSAGGQVLIAVDIDDSAGASVGAGLWYGTPGGLSKVGRTGESVSSTYPEIIYEDDFYLGSIASTGQIAFSASIEDTPFSNSMLFAGDPGAPVPIAGPSRSQVDALPSGWQWGNFQSSFPFINSVGDVLFISELNNPEGSPRDSIWLASDGELELVFLEATQAPGVEPGVLMGIGTTFEFSHVINDRSEVLYSTNLYGTGVDNSNDKAIYFYSSGLNHLIIREGDLVPVTLSDGSIELRQVSEFALAQRGSSGSNGYDNSPASINPDGTLAVALEFVDGTSGIFIYDLSPRPAADIDGDGAIGAGDLEILINAWGTQVGTRVVSMGDLSGDSWVGIADLDALLAAWPAGTPIPTFIPEPGTAMVLFSGWLLIGTRHSRRRLTTRQAFNQ